MKRKILSAVLCAAILCAALCTGAQAVGMNEFRKTRKYSGQFQDIKGKWCEKYIADLYEYGLAEGTGKAAMSPDDPVTVAQVVTLAARVSAIYYNVTIGATDGKWYEPYISYALDYGLITEDEAGDVERPATRGESALILSRTLPAQQFESVSDAGGFSDVGRDEPCRDAVLMLSRAGVIAGYVDGTFRPGREISRAEVMTIVDRIVNKSLRRGYSDWLLQSQQPSGGGSGDMPDPGPIGIGVGFGRATFALNGVAMLNLDMENSSFVLAVAAGNTGGMITITGVCEVRDVGGGRFQMSCIVSDRAAQNGASLEAAAQAAALSAMAFIYDGNRTIQFTEAVVNGTSVIGNNIGVVGALKTGAILTGVN